MTITAKCLIESSFAPASVVTLYTAPANTRVIIDKFTGTNVTASDATLSVYLVPSGSTAGTSNLIVSVETITASSKTDFTMIQNHILNPGDFIAVLGGTANSITIRSSGREVAS